MDTSAAQAAQDRAKLKSQMAEVAAMRAKQWQEALDILLEVGDASLQDASTTRCPPEPQLVLALQHLIAKGNSSGDDNESSSGSDTGSSDADSDADNHESNGESDDEQDEQQGAEGQDGVPDSGEAAADEQQQQEQPLQTHHQQQQSQQLGGHADEAVPGTAQAPGMAFPTAAVLSTTATSTQHAVLLQDTRSSARSMQAAEAVAGAGGIAHTAQHMPVLNGIQLAASSFSLSHSDRAFLRKQLAAGLEQHRAAQALEKALANDPLLSMSLS